MPDDEPVVRLRRRLDPFGIRYDVEGLLKNPNLTAVPAWWSVNGNRLYLDDGVEPPQILAHPGLPPPQNAVVALAFGCRVGEIVLWGDGPIVCLAYSVKLPLSSIACGGDSTIVANNNVSAGEGSRINARNGGLIFIGADGLWSSGVTAYTDDMHAICDVVTGQRINPKGGHIVIEPHVWIGLEAMILRSVRIGQDSVVGARSLVTSDLPANCIGAGVPARKVREGVKWNVNDL